MIETTPKPRRRILKPILVSVSVGLGLILFIIVGFGSWHAFLRPVPVPVIDASADQLLVTTTTLARNDAVTSVTYQPFITLTRDLPTSIAVQCDRLNARVDRVFRRIAQYERDKLNLDFKSSWRELEAIDQDYIAANQGRLADLESRALQYRQWYYHERIAVCARHQEWKMASFMTRYSHQFETQLEASNYYRDHPVGEPFDSDAWERKAGEQAWDREVYFWRQMGGAEGYYRIAFGSVERTYERVIKKAPQPVRAKLPYRLDLN